VHEQRRLAKNGRGHSLAGRLEVKDRVVSSLSPGRKRKRF